MKIVKKYAAPVFLAVFSFILVSCAGGTAISGYDNELVYGKPSWYWNPGDGGLIGGVGESGLHINGPSAQRQLAISRAIDDIAKQKGVTVKNIQEITQYATQDTSFVNISTYSVQTVNGTYVTARVREVWQDPATGRIVVWATEVK